MDGWRPKLSDTFSVSKTETEEGRRWMERTKETEGRRDDIKGRG